MKKKSNLKGIISEYKDIVIVVGILVIIVLVCAIVFNIVSKKEEGNTEEEIVTTTLTLFGNRTINLEVGEDFEEPGYYAIDSNGVLQTSNIIITNNVDTTKPGTYEIIYRIADKEEIRTVIVEGEEIKEPVTSEKKPLTLTLTGEKVINLSLGEAYKEPGYKATDSNGLDATEKVLVLGEVDTSKVGNYTLTYVLEDGEDKKEVIRTIVVLDDKLTITLTPNTTNYASSITLNIKVTGNNFASLTLPNQNIVKSASNNYNITSNGTYTVTAYNKNGGKFEKSITITNIDKTAPTGTCQVTINNNNTTTFNIIAADSESGINNYVYYDDGKQFLNTTTGSYVYQQKTTKNVYVKVYDKAKNEKFIYCDITDNSALPVILPGKKDNVVKKGETETLKVYIIKKGSYYITRIWAQDPYHQLNKFDSPEYGKKLYRPKTLLNKAKTKYNLQNKLILGFNASAFYLRGVYDAYEVSKYSKYDKTSVGTLVITDGKVIRNAYNKAYKTRYIVGVDPNNKLRIFTDAKGTSSAQIKKKKEWAQSVIDSGIRNTFTHASPLIQNGKKSNITTNMPSPSTRKNRQAICQIDDNNFALITGGNLNRSDLQNIMLNLKCQTGSNLDGGGSIALFFQANGSNTISTIKGNGRDLTEVAYFTEK